MSTLSHIKWKEDLGPHAIASAVLHPTSASATPMSLGPRCGLSSVSGLSALSQGSVFVCTGVSLGVCCGLS